MKTRDQIIAENPIEREFQRRGYELIRKGTELACVCPFHEDKSPSLRISTQKQTWFCDPCGFGGSVIDLVSRLDGITTGAAMRKLAGSDEMPTAKPAPVNSKIVATYDYKDANGNPVFQVVRLEPKSFRQRRQVDGQWTWNMEGVERVLYRMPVVAKSEFVWIVEGEKDADMLISMGLCGTCNPGGAGKWLDGYTAALKGKEVILCGDNDEPGQKHIAKVAAAIGGVVKTSRTIKVPDPHKDVSDFVASFSDKAAARAALVDLAESAEVLVRGVKLPVFTMAEMEKEYREFVRRMHLVALRLEGWVPAFGPLVRPIVPGELVTVLASTGVGKTAVLQNIAMNTRLPTLMFEVELPNTLTFERYAGMATEKWGGKVEQAYRDTEGVDWRSSGKLDHIAVCPESKLPVSEIERIINMSGLKTGSRPVLILVDYAQLVKGDGHSRYDRASDVAEELRVIAKSTGTIIVMASQVGRKGDNADHEVYIHDAKESGSIENSSSLVLGTWRDPDDKNRMWLKILKNTKGVSGAKIACRIHDGFVIKEEEKQPTEEPAEVTKVEITPSFRPQRAPRLNYSKRR